MRKTTPLDALFPRTRQLLLAATLMSPDRWWYLSDLAKHLGLRPSSLQRDLTALVNAGILRRRRDGNRVYYQPDPDCPFLTELHGIVIKTIGLVDVLHEALAPFAERIQWAFIFGSIARSEEFSTSDVDLMIIGRVGLAEIAPALRRAERRLNRAVNPVVYTPEELARKLQSGHHFLNTVLDQEKLFIQGDPHELAATFGHQPHPAPRYEPAGD